MKIWVGEKYELAFSAVVCFCIYYFVYEINQLFNMYKDAAGIWHQDRLRPLVTAGSNLAMNLIMVQFWGIYGVILSTILSMLFVGMPWLLHNLFTVFFPKKYLKEYLNNLATFAGVSILGCLITYVICSFVHLSNYSNLIVNGIICLIIPNAIFFAAYRKRTEFAQSIQLADKMTKRKLSVEKCIIK